MTDPAPAQVEYLNGKSGAEARNNAPVVPVEMGFETTSR